MICSHCVEECRREVTLYTIGQDRSAPQRGLELGLSGVVSNERLPSMVRRIRGDARQKAEIFRLTAGSAPISSDNHGQSQHVD